MFKEEVMKRICPALGHTQLNIQIRKFALMYRITKVEKIKNEIGNYSTRILPNRNSISPRIARIVPNSRAKSSRIARIPNSRTKSSKTESVHQIPSADSRPRNSCQDIFCSILQFFSQ